MSKGKYKSIEFEGANVDELREVFEGGEVVVCTDVAKEGMYTGLARPDGHIETIVTWTNPDQLEAFADWVDALGAECVTLVLEPSGTYGEPLRAAASERGWAIFLVSPKRLHDAAEVFDGVPSLHDAKAAWLLATMHAQGLSQPWGIEGDGKRRLAALIKTMVRYDQIKRQNLGRLEGELARWWPEVTTIIKKDSATMLALLTEFGGPAGIAERSDEARQLMKEVSNGLLRPDKVEGIIESARQTNGQTMLPTEERMLADLARHTDAMRRRTRLWKRSVEEAVDDFEGASRVGEVVGDATAAVFRTKVGDFRDYHSPEALLKKFGLNLKERSSGKYKGELKITKRGPGQARSYLYWAALRMIHSNAVFRAWHKKKVARDAGMRMKSVVALMRKLVKGLWHVARGATFDATRLFDVSRLELDA